MKYANSLKSNPRAADVLRRLLENVPAKWLALYARSGSHYFYADQAGLESLRTHLKLEPASKGENVVVTILEDPGIFRDVIEPAAGVTCTSLVQTYLDLIKSGERGQEAANHLRKERLQWRTAIPASRKSRAISTIGLPQR